MPETPSGWPSAMAPPLTFSFSRVDAELARAVERLRGERLVELEEIDVLDLQPGGLSTLRTAGTGPMPMISGGTPATAKARKQPSGLTPELPWRARRTSRTTRRGAVGERRRVAGGDRAGRDRTRA